MLTIWNKTVKNLIFCTDYRSILLGLILLKDPETMLQWWEYGAGIELLELPLQKDNDAMAQAWDHLYQGGVRLGAKREGLRETLREKYKKYHNVNHLEQNGTESVIS